MFEKIMNWFSVPAALVGMVAGVLIAVFWASPGFLGFLAWVVVLGLAAGFAWGALAEVVAKMVRGY